MRHLSESELLDLAEGAVADASSPHLASCEPCRRAVADLRSIIQTATDVEVPEPSPLFWDHLSARVREAVDAERRTGRTPGTLGAFVTARRFSWRAITPLGGIAAVLLVVLLLSWDPRGNSRIATEQRAGSDPVEILPAAVDMLPVANDSSLDLLADLTQDLDWDAVTAAGLTPRAGAIDGLVKGLDTEERQELGRLLNEAMTGKGA
jgi:hypothetical protein